MNRCCHILTGPRWMRRVVFWRIPTISACSWSRTTVRYETFVTSSQITCFVLMSHVDVQSSQYYHGRSINRSVFKVVYRCRFVSCVQTWGHVFPSCNKRHRTSLLRITWSKTDRLSSRMPWKTGLRWTPLTSNSFNRCAVTILMMSNQWHSAVVTVEVNQRKRKF